VLQCIAAVSNLEELELDCSDLMPDREDVCIHLSGLVQLQSLHLQGAESMTTADALHLTHLTRLASLSLIPGVGPEAAATLEVTAHGGTAG
jgi:hypothetical protein